MKIEWFVTGVTAVGAPRRAEHSILGVILAFFLANQDIFVVAGPFCGVGTPS